jgi:hypothetical protein
MNIPTPSRKRLYLIAAAGIVLELVGIYLIVARDVSVAVAAPLLIIGMFMSFAPAIAAKKASGA